MSPGLTQSFSIIVIYFTAYSFYGWVCETIYCSAIERRYVQRGFLRGPYCPIYGFGALIVLRASYPLAGNPALVFVVTMIVASVLEYVTGGFFEHFFQLRLWDYSGQKFNIKGRVCLLNAILFGILGLLAVYLVHPATMKLVNVIPPDAQSILGSLLIVLLLVDFLQSVAAVSDLNERLREVQGCLRELKAYQAEYSWFDRNDLASSIERLQEICEREPGDSAPLILERLRELSELKNRSDRFIRNYPTLRAVSFAEELSTLRENLQERSEAAASRVRQRIGSVGIRLSAAIGQICRNARTIEFETLAWTFVAGGVAGYFVRTLLNSLAAGRLTSGQSVLYGPFTTLYAVGAVLIVLCIEPPAKANDRRLFLGSAILGGALEYAGNWLDGRALGIAFWQYDSWSAVFGGRLSPLSLLAWGVFGVVLVRYVVPWLRNLLRGLPVRRNRALACLLLLTLSGSFILSSTALFRWEERYRGIAPRGDFQAYIDARYPDETMREVFPNVRFTGEEKRR